LTVVKIYTDTNVLHYFGAAFATEQLPDDVPVQLLLSPLSIMELLSQLGTRVVGEGAFNAIRALPRVHNPAGTGMLPFSDDFFCMALFNLPPNEDTTTPALNRAVNNVLAAENAEQLRTESLQMRDLLNREKDREATNLDRLITSLRAEGPLDETTNRTIFARSIAGRAGINETEVDVARVVEGLNAHFLFESERMRAGARQNNYNVARRRNDLFDAELLIYLADPSLHFLTSDRGFERANVSSQAARIHIVSPASLSTSEAATTTLRDLAASAMTGPGARS
jgi:hypothetical protein